MKNGMKQKSKALFLAFALILFLLPGIFAALTGAHRAAEILAAEKEGVRTVTWAEEYPFADPAPAGAGSMFSAYPAAAQKLTDFIEAYSGSSNRIAPPFLDLYGKIASALGKQIIDDVEGPVIRLPNGYLTNAYFYAGDVVKYPGIVSFNTWLAEKGIPFLAVLPAEKSDDRYAPDPIVFPSGYAEKENEYIGYLQSSGIQYLNARETLLSENTDFFSWFYKTDHHWNVHAGFSLAAAIAERLSAAFALPVEPDILDIARFSTVTYEGLFLGSQGKKVTRGYIAPDDFEVTYPLFDTSFSIQIPTKAIDRAGPFEDTLIDAEALQDGQAYAYNGYGAFLHGDLPLVRVHNLTNQSGVRALMIKTSDANVVDTYLAFTLEYLDVIDPRHFDGSIRTFIEKTHPDVVLTCAYPSKDLDDRLLDIK